MNDSPGLTQTSRSKDDPSRAAYAKARYLITGKMLAGRRHIFEVGCGDGENIPIILQHSGADSVVAFDKDREQVRALRHRRVIDKDWGAWPIEAHVLDVLTDSIPGYYNGAYALDVLEHIPADQERRALTTICNALEDRSRLIIGMPSLESQIYASPISRSGHVNCKSAPDLRALLERFFYDVEVFGINDTTLHMGHYGMCHYLLARCFLKRP